jgi:hypothetical protein
MKRIRMLVDKKGSPDGIQVQLYKTGQVYLLPERLADIFLKAGWAEEDKTLEAMIETKEATVEDSVVKPELKTKTRKK